MAFPTRDVWLLVGWAAIAQPRGAIERFPAGDWSSVGLQLGQFGFCFCLPTGIKTAKEPAYKDGYADGDAKSEEETEGDCENFLEGVHVSPSVLAAS